MRFKKGIILAAGKGTRLSPATKVTVKPLLPLYDKPLLYYALSNLIKAGVREVLFISQKKDIPEFRKLFGSGKQLGMKFSYTFQKKQVGIPDAVNIAKKFINKKVLVIKAFLVSILVVVAILSLPILVTKGNTHFKHALEWNYFVGVIVFYLLSRFFWRRTT